jgi:hypothetical protein
LLSGFPLVRYTWHRRGCSVLAGSVRVSRRKLVVVGLLILVAVVFILQGGRHIGTSNSSANTQCQIQVGTNTLNVRSAPEPNATVLEQLHGGAITTATSTVQNGFRQLAVSRWVDNQFVKPVAGSC